jgi:nitrite reductase/ring-hydroxylating ferredoxin subunit
VLSPTSAIADGASLGLGFQGAVRHSIVLVKKVASSGV